MSQELIQEPKDLTLSTSQDGDDVFVIQDASDNELYRQKRSSLLGSVNADTVDSYHASDKALRPLRFSSIADSSDIASTATETAFSVSYTIPAGFLEVGDVIRVAAWGLYSTTGTPTGSVSVRIGGVGGQFVNIVGFTCASGVSNNAWQTEAQAIVRAVGASGVISRGPSHVAVEGVGGGGLFGQSGGGGDLSLDTTATQQVVVTWKWGTASPSNTAKMIHLAVWVFKANATS